MGRIIASYATGPVLKPGRSYTGGLIGRRSGGNNQVTNSYWDRQTTGRSDAFFGIWGCPKCTADLKGPTGYWGIYGGWNQNVDGQGGADDPWDFGTSSDYPVLKFGGLDQAPQRDHDRDNDNLIEIYNLSQLDAIRQDLGRDGAVDAATDADDADAYYAAFTGPVAQLGCADACAGYELIASLNFDTDGDGSADRDDQFWDDGKGWQPIGSAAAPYDTEFAGNGHTLSNLFISRGDTENVGLFGAVGSAASIYALALPAASVTGSRTAAGNVGALAGKNAGAVAASFVTGAVAGSANDSVGGLVGRRRRWHHPRRLFPRRRIRRQLRRRRRHGDQCLLGHRRHRTERQRRLPGLHRQNRRPAPGTGGLRQHLRQLESQPGRRNRRRHPLGLRRLHRIPRPHLRRYAERPPARLRPGRRQPD